MSRPDAAALSAYGELLAGASRLVLRGGSFRNSVGGTITIDVDEQKGAMILEVGPPPNETAWVRDDIYPYFSAQLKLGDGRVVLSLRMEQAQNQGPYKLPGVLAMDGDGPVRVEDEAIRPSAFDCYSHMCDPISTMPRAKVTHPESADAALRKGHQLTAPQSLNGAYNNFNSFCVLPLAFVTCCSGPVFLACCVPAPSVHNELSVRATCHLACAACSKRSVLLPHPRLLLDVIHVAGGGCGGQRRGRALREEASRCLFPRLVQILA